MPSRVALLILLSVVLALAIWPAPRVRGPTTSTPAGSRTAADPGNGWRSFESAHAESIVTDSCGVGGGLEAAFDGEGAPSGWEAGWSFVAPEGTQISAVSVIRLALSEYFPIYPGSLEYLATLDAWPAATDATVERCVASSAAPCDISLSRPFERVGLQHASISFGLRCTEGGGCSCRPGQGRSPRWRFSLRA